MGEELLEEFIKNKVKVKKNLCKKLSFEHDMPLIGLVIDKELADSHRNSIERFLEGTGALDVEIVVVADTNLDSFSFPHVHYVPYNEKSRKELMQASDIMVAMPFNDLEEMFLNGVVPISHEREGAMNYDPNQESGNSFVYSAVDIGENGVSDTRSCNRMNLSEVCESNSSVDAHWKIFAALVRALETFKFPYDWKNIINSCLESVHQKKGD
jgi:hypothetical protein